MGQQQPQRFRKVVISELIQLNQNASMKVKKADGTLTFDTSGYLLNLAGVTEANAKLFNAHTLSNVNEVTHGLRVSIAGSDYYLLMATQANFVD